MTRPNIDPNALVTSMEGWDAVVKDYFGAIAQGPFAPKEYANAAALPTASAFPRCIACTIDTNKLWFSNGTIWKEVTLS